MGFRRKFQRAMGVKNAVTAAMVGTDKIAVPARALLDDEAKHRTILEAPSTASVVSVEPMPLIGPLDGLTTAEEE